MLFNSRIKPIPSEKNTQNTLNKIDINSTLYDTFSQTVISQIYKNNTDKSQEISFECNMGNNTVLHSFTAKINNKVFKSKIYDKETAQEKYSDSIASGNAGILLNVDETNQDIFSISIGNLQPGEELQLDVEFMSEVKTYDLSYKFFFPLFRIPKLIVEKNYVSLPVIFLKERPDVYESSVPVTFSAIYLSPSKITRFACLSHKNTLPQFSDDNLIAQLNIPSDELYNTKSPEISILFRNEDLNIPRLYEEYDPKLKVYSYMLNYKMDERTGYKTVESVDTNPLMSYHDNYEKSEINDTPSSFIFLLDQSGSMSGTSIETAKEALKIFIKSLPADSEFSVIGFGSNYKDYFNILQYNENNVQKALNHVKTLQANLGGTNIYHPLDYIFKKSKEFKKDYPKNIFLLTDGCVEDSSSCLDLIRNNNNNFRVHSLGIGSDVSSDFITSCGEVGKGTYNFAKEVKEITSKVINSLNCALKAYYSNIKIYFSTELKIELDYPEKNSLNIIYQDEVLSYSFITKEKMDKDSYITITATSAFKEKELDKKLNVQEIIFPLPSNNHLNKLIAALRCKNDDKLKPDELKTISKLYQVATKETSLFAEVENTNSSNSEMTNVKIPVTYISRPQSSLDKGIIRSFNPRILMAAPNRIKCVAPTLTSMTFGSSPPIVSLNSLVSSPSVSIGSNVTQHAMMTKEKKFKKIKSNKEEKLSIHKEKNNFNINNFDKEDKYEDESDDRSNDICFEECEKEQNSTLNMSTDIYKDLIDSQMISGEWSEYNDKNGVIKKVIQKYSNEMKKITEFINGLNISIGKETQGNIIVTSLVVWILNIKYSELKDEYFLISNKAKKFLSKFKVKYEDVETLLK